MFEGFYEAAAKGNKRVKLLLAKISTSTIIQYFIIDYLVYFVPSNICLPPKMFDPSLMFLVVACYG